MSRMTRAALLTVPLLLASAVEARAWATPGCGPCMSLFSRMHFHGPLYNYGPYCGYYPFAPYGPYDANFNYNPYWQTPCPGGHCGGGSGLFSHWHNGGGLFGHKDKGGCGADGCSDAGCGGKCGKGLGLFHGHKHKEAAAPAECSSCNTAVGCTSCGPTAAAPAGTAGRVNPGMPALAVTPASLVIPYAR